MFTFGFPKSNGGVPQQGSIPSCWGATSDGGEAASGGKSDAPSAGPKRLRVESWSSPSDLSAVEEYQGFCGVALVKAEECSEGFEVPVCKRPKTGDAGGEAERSSQAPLQDLPPRALDGDAPNQVFRGIVAVIDSDLGAEVVMELRAAILSGGGREASGAFLGSGATHVVRPSMSCFAKVLPIPPLPSASSRRDGNITFLGDLLANPGLGFGSNKVCLRIILRFTDLSPPSSSLADLLHRRPGPGSQIPVYCLCI